MAEYCLDCFNKLIAARHFDKSEVRLSSFRCLCEGCEEMKQVVLEEKPKFELLLTDNHKDYGEREQEVWSENKDESVYFRAFDMSDCPEDAVIGRDLFTAKDFIRAVELGFRIAKRGYDSIKVTEVPYGE